jgi:hypothetical protein
VGTGFVVRRRLVAERHSTHCGDRKDERQPYENGDEGSHGCSTVCAQNDVDDFSTNADSPDGKSLKIAFDVSILRFDSAFWETWQKVNAWSLHNKYLGVRFRNH